MPGSRIEAFFQNLRVGRAADAPDGDLLRRFVQGDDGAAFAALVQRHGPMVLNLCRRALGNAHDAEDAFQATFLLLARKGAAVRSPDLVASWLYGAAHRLSLKARTAAGRRRARESAATAREQPAPETELTVREAQEAIDEELARLPEKFRAPLVLCCLEGLARDEAAERLGWTTALVKSRLEQARELLRARLSARGLTLPAGLLAVGLLGPVASAVPPAVGSVVIRAAPLVAAGAPLSAVVSPPVAALIEGALHTMWWNTFKACAALLLVLAGVGTAASAFLAPARELASTAVRPPVPVKKGEPPAPVEKPKPEALKRYGSGEALLVARVTDSVGRGVGLSDLPVWNTQLELKIDRPLRGPVKKGDAVKAFHSARQKDQPSFTTGKDYVVAMNQARGMWQVVAIHEATADEVKGAAAVAALPLGWTVTKEGKLASPWAGLGKMAWAGPRGKGVACEITGRPALLAGAVDLKVEHVKPAVQMKWGNPDGDGEYRITLKNNTGGELRIPALLHDGKKPMWEESLVILSQGKVYPAPGAKGVSLHHPQPTTLKPGEEISTTVHALKLVGPTWPRGGYRIDFTFCLGEHAVTKSFYYLSKHHDEIRKKVSGEKAKAAP